MSSEGLCERESPDTSPDLKLKKIDHYKLQTNVNKESCKLNDKCNAIINGNNNFCNINVDELADTVTQSALKSKISDDDEIIIENEVNEEKEGEQSYKIEPIYENVHLGEYAKKEYISNVKDKCNNNVNRRLV